MENLPTSMKHDISVVTVFCLKKVHHQTICCQTVHECLLSLTQPLSEVYLEELLQGQSFWEIVLQVFFKLIEGNRIFDHFNYT